MTNKRLAEGATDEDMRALGAQGAIAEEAEEWAERRALMEIVARCPVCARDYVSVPKDGGTCLWCRATLVAVKGPE